MSTAASLLAYLLPSLSNGGAQMRWIYTDLHTRLYIYRSFFSAYAYVYA